MPTIVNPNGARPYTAAPGVVPDAASHGRASSLQVRVRTAVHRVKLTQALAEGADPRSSDELALRARQLTRPRQRKTIASGLRAVTADAYNPPRTRARVALVDRHAVLDAEPLIAEMIKRLVGPEPVEAEGMAMIERLLTNADGHSPLYNASEPGTLRRTILVAIAALDRQPSRSEEAWLAA